MLGTMLARDIDQKEFNTLMDELRIKIQRLKRLTENVAPNVAEKAELATLKEECCITENDKLNFKGYLAKKGYSPQLNGIRFGIENITIIPSTGDGTPVMRGSATVLKNIDYSDLCFQSCDFNQVDLSHCVIKNSEFSKCRWTEASLRSCQIENVTFERNTFIFLTQFHPEVYRDPKLKNNLSPINNYILESFHQAVKDSKKKRAAQLQIKAELAKLKKTSGAIRNGKACIRPSEDPASLVPVSVGPLRPESMAYPNDDSLSHQIRSILFQFFNTYHLPYTDSGHGYEPPQPHAYHFRPFILGR